MKKASFVPSKTVYYTDELNDEFSDAVICARTIDETYKYVPKNPFWKIGSFILYRIIMLPIAFLYSKIALGHKVKNKSALKAVRGGFFLFANHTQQIGDAFMPNVVLFPKKVYMVVHPNNVSMPYLGRITKMLGAIPTPTSHKAMRNFKNAIEKRVLDGGAVVIYPEAHIWPYYTGIRNFPATSMTFPTDFNEPSFTMTTTYQRTRRGKVRAVSYIDGPFYPDVTLPYRQRSKDLRDRIHEAMRKRSLLSDCEYIKYVKKEDLT